VILHLDMDAFFAAVEVLDRPALKGVCLAVGGSGPRSVVAAASYAARRHGVRSAMPMATARRLCRDLVVVPPRRARYQEISARVMAILGDYSPLVEQVSIDEAYLDLGGCERLLGPHGELGLAIKGRIHRETGLTCSVGIAPLRFLAKIASEMRKPDGLVLIQPHEVPAIVERLPVEQVPGVGARTRQSLAELGVRRLGQVLALPEALLDRRLGRFGRRLRELAMGIDGTPVHPATAAKSVSSEETLAQDTRDKTLLRRLLLGHCDRVGRQLRAEGLRARNVALKIRHADFSLHTRSRKLPRSVQSGAALFQAAAALLEAYPTASPIRLIGVGAGSLIGAGEPRQCSLFCAEPEQEGRWERVEQAVDRVAERFGRGALRRASQAPGGSDPPE
jgi:DNA polymerase-4